MKEKYTSPECKIITFSSEDVITTSGLKAYDLQSEFDEYDEECFK